MESELPDASDRVSTWNTRDLTSVFLGLIGITLMVEVVLAGMDALYTGAASLGIEDLGFFRRGVASFGMEDWGQAAVLVGLAVALVLGSSRISRLIDPRPASAEPPQDMVALLAAGLAVLGVVVLFDRLDSVVRVLLPFLEYTLDDPIPIRSILADTIAGGAGVVLFLKSGAIARWWRRWNRVR